MPDSNLVLQWVLAAGAVLVIAAAAFLLVRGRSRQKGVNVTVSEDRLQRAAEAILNDESLTDEMSDAPANRLIEWAVGISRQIVIQTADLPETEAQEQLDAKLQGLRRVTRRVNKLVGSMASGASEELTETLQKVMEVASQVEGLHPQAPADLSAAVERLRKLPPEEAVKEILSYIHKGDQDGETPQQKAR